ncbi:hypothetical protein M9H77_07548 [Catharanthus roseus]|uniref:Uncharacterized protein n=1 Tax=Catharanthus roseus TaxID=4058 RepID=A0ACC0BV99_CATRO|nr:hypothetical protein M9H77_07548 [Catharanthus roseus]
MFSEPSQNVAIFGTISLNVFLEMLSTVCYEFSRKMHRSGCSIDYHDDKWPFCSNTNEKPHFDQGVNSGYDLVFGSVKGLHYTWLVLHTRASSDGVDISDSREWIHLKRGIDCEGCGPIGLRGYHIILYGGVRLPSGELGGARN